MSSRDKKKLAGRPAPAARRASQKPDVRGLIQITVVTSGPDLGILWTRGMEAFQRPNLLMRGVPLFLQAPAARLINAAADYVLFGAKPVEAGQTLRDEELGVVIRFVEDVYDGETFWRLSDDPMRSACSGCGRSTCGTLH